MQISLIEVGPRYFPEVSEQSVMDRQPTRGLVPLGLSHLHFHVLLFIPGKMMTEVIQAHVLKWPFKNPLTYRVRKTLNSNWTHCPVLIFPPSCQFQLPPTLIHLESTNEVHEIGCTEVSYPRRPHCYLTKQINGRCKKVMM